MTHTRQMHDDDGDFGAWQPTEVRCLRLLWREGEETSPRERREAIGRCDAPAQCRKWESHDGAYEDWQYRCENGHVWWEEGIDA